MLERKKISPTLEAIEDANIDALQEVLKGINFNHKIGQRIFDEGALAEFGLNFRKSRSAMRI